MIKHFSWVPLFAATVFPLFATQAFAQAAPGEPWAKVPPLTTQCYSGKDPFLGKVETARAAVVAESERQGAINTKIEEEFRNIDPMEMASRMQQWMMSNPQEAMKYMQTSQTMGQEAQNVSSELNVSYAGFDTEAKDLATKYRADLKLALSPQDARFAALNKKVEAENGCGMFVGECGNPAWALAEFDVIQRERDASYQATCAKWWTASGPVHGYFKRYRDFLVQKWIPNWMSQEEAKLTQYAIMNTPAASWKSTYAHQQVDKYLGTAWTLFELRNEQPICTPKGCLH